MARTYTSANLRCARPDCDSKSIYRVICTECNRCFHTGCVNLEDKDFKIFLCPECNEAIREGEETARCLSEDKSKNVDISSQAEKYGEKIPETCADPRCEKRDRCSCHRSYKRSSKPPDKDIDYYEKKISLSNGSDEDEEIDPLNDSDDEEEDEVQTPCANKPCGLKGKHKIVCLSCRKFYHSGCIAISTYDHRTFWCDNCCFSPARDSISYLDISAIAYKIDGFFNMQTEISRNSSPVEQNSIPGDLHLLLSPAPDAFGGSTRPNDQAPGSDDQQSRPEEQGQGATAVVNQDPGPDDQHTSPNEQGGGPAEQDPMPDDIEELLNYDPFINDPDLVNYDPVLAANSYNPALGPRPSTIEEIRAWRDRVREAEREIQRLEMRMQKARVIDREFYGTFQEVVDQDMIRLYYATPCEAQFCTFRGRFRVMCYKCQRIFHTGCLSLPDYDFETSVCFYCPLSEPESDSDDDDKTEDFFMELHL